MNHVGGKAAISSYLEDLEEDEDGKSYMGYQQTLMYGRYSKSLGDQIREEAKRLKEIEKERRVEFKRRQKELSGRSEVSNTITRIASKVWKHTFYRVGGEDWVFLAVLGIIMAIISFCMDYTILLCNQARIWMVTEVLSQTWLQFLAWTFLPTFLILFSAGFVHMVAPQAIGSGIPELKTIMRGVNLKEYLTLRTLIAKVVGLTATLGAGMPLGKEGPFVHTASCVATLLTKLMGSFKRIHDNPTRKSEMLAAACAVGVSCCFGAPIGGVLFSIEVTSVFFAIRNYWRGFFAATCGAIMFKLLAIWFFGHSTFFSFFKTEFLMDVPYDPQELVAFAFIGVICGLGGALYVYLHRRYVLWMRGNKQLSKFLQKNRFIYPFFIAFFLSCCTFPAGPGRYQAGALTTHQQVDSLFSNHTWTRNISTMTVVEYEMVRHWIDPSTGSIFLSVSLFSLYAFLGSILASTLPVPTGVVIPSFKTGAGIGRMVGEAMALWFPLGIVAGNPIVPGGYSVVGAAAFTGAVTRTVSISMIVFEMTGQKTHCVPVLVAVIISNCIASLLQPSCFDSIIIIKKLPYLPNIIPSSSKPYNYFVESFMLKEIKYIWHGMTYNRLKEVLKESRKIKVFPLVDTPGRMILLGSVNRIELISAIEMHIGKERRMAEALRRKHEQKQSRLIAAQRLEYLDMDTVNHPPPELGGEVAGDGGEVAGDGEEKKDEMERMANGANGAGGRRPSRFSVSTVNRKGGEAQPAEGEQPIPELNIDAEAVKALLDVNASTPKKSILKKHRSFNVHDTVSGLTRRGMETPPEHTHHNTIHNMVVTSMGSGRSSTNNSRHNTWDFRNMDSNWTPLSSRKKLVWPDLSLEEQRQWEREQMEKPVNFAQIHIDPAPFQLVEKSSILKVHSLFSMLGINTAYVTTLGKLIGVVGLPELRMGIENVNSGNLPADEPAVAADDAENGGGGGKGDEEEEGCEPTKKPSATPAIVVTNSTPTETVTESGQGHGGGEGERLLSVKE